MELDLGFGKIGGLEEKVGNRGSLYRAGWVEPEAQVTRGERVEPLGDGERWDGDMEGTVGKLGFGRMGW